MEALGLLFVGTTLLLLFAQAGDSFAASIGARRHWAPRGDLAFRGSLMKGAVQRWRERQGVPVPQGAGDFWG